jgi:hypothetical protein
MITHVIFEKSKRNIPRNMVVISFIYAVSRVEVAATKSFIRF